MVEDTYVIARESLETWHSNKENLSHNEPTCKNIMAKARIDSVETILAYGLILFLGRRKPKTLWNGEALVDEEISWKRVAAFTTFQEDIAPYCARKLWKS